MVSEWEVLLFVVLITDKGVHTDSKPGRSRSRLSNLTSKVFIAFDLYSSKVIVSSGKLFEY